MPRLAELTHAPRGSHAAVGCGLRASLVCLQLVTSIGCGDTTAPAASTTQPARSEAAAADGGKPNLKLDRKALQRRAQQLAQARDPGAWRSLSFFLPGVIEGYRARSVTEGHTLDVGAELPVLLAKRSYAKAAVTLDLEVIDTARSERLRSLFTRARELSRDNELAVFRALKVQGQRAFAQWLAATETARASVLVADRYLVNVNTKPVASPAASLALLQKLDLSALDKLASAPLPAATPASPNIAAVSDEPRPTPFDAGADAALLASQPP